MKLSTCKDVKAMDATLHCIQNEICSWDCFMVCGWSQKYSPRSSKHDSMYVKRVRCTVGYVVLYVKTFQVSITKRNNHLIDLPQKKEYTSQGSKLCAPRFRATSSTYHCHKLDIFMIIQQVKIKFKVGQYISLDILIL